MLRWRKKPGQSSIEFVTMTIAILAAFVIFQKYILRGFSGRWKEIGDSMGHGRLYDANTTTECSYDPTSGAWFDQSCYDESGCAESCFGFEGEDCADCIAGCSGGGC